LINFSSINHLIKTPDEILKYYKSQSIILQIYDDLHLIDKCSILQNFMDETPAESEYDGIKTWFKYEEEIKSVTMCGGTVLECDLFHLFAVLSEIDLMEKFISQFEEVNKLSEITKFRWLMQVKVKMPLTFSNRDLVINGFGIINKEQKSILMPFKSVDHFLDLNIPPETSKQKRIFMHFGFYNIQYLSENKYYVSCAFNLDPKVPIVPWFILNNVMKKITYYIIDGLRKQIYSEKAKEIYHKRVEEKKEFYEALREALNILE
jgi:hypothetical protein